MAKRNRNSYIDKPHAVLRTVPCASDMRCAKDIGGGQPGCGFQGNHPMGHKRGCILSSKRDVAHQQNGTLQKEKTVDQR